MRVALVFLFLLQPVSVFAQEVQTTLFCQKLAQHSPDDDVNFKPGRDIVNGKPVVSADLGGGAAFPSLVDPLRIPIRAPIDGFLSGSVADLAGDTGSPPIAAFIEVYQDGRVLYNGVDISMQTATLCNKDEILADEVPTGNGQQGEDILKSPKAKEPALIEIRKNIEGQTLEGEILEGQYP